MAVVRADAAPIVTSPRICPRRVKVIATKNATRLTISAHPLIPCVECLADLAGDAILHTPLQLLIWQRCRALAAVGLEKTGAALRDARTLGALSRLGRSDATVSDTVSEPHRVERTPCVPGYETVGCSAA